MSEENPKLLPSAARIEYARWWYTTQAAHEKFMNHLGFQDAEDLGDFVENISSL